LRDVLPAAPAGTISRLSISRARPIEPDGGRVARRLLPAPARSL